MQSTLTPAPALGGADSLEARVEAARGQVEALATEDGFRRWIASRKHVRHLSWHNQALIAQQAHLLDIVPTDVQAPYRWKRAGYHPAKGSRAFYIWAYRSHRRKAGTWTCCGQVRREAACPECRRLDHYFRLAPAYAASQVVSFEDGTPPPGPPPCAPITGDELGERWIDALTVAADALSGAEVQFKTGIPHKGWFDKQANEIVIDADQSLNEQLATLVHELAHAMGVNYDSYGRESAEMVAESVCVVVCDALGLDTAMRSIPYVAGWGQDSAVERAKQLVSDVADIAGRIESELGLDEEDLDDAA
jgi:hypothetical protein